MILSLARSNPEGAEVLFVTTEELGEQLYIAPAGGGRPAEDVVDRLS
jgi:hypothetical protein